MMSARSGENTTRPTPDLRLPQISAAEAEGLKQLWAMRDSLDAPLLLRPSKHWPQSGWLALRFGNGIVKTRFLDDQNAEFWDRFQCGLAEDYWLDARLARHADAIDQLEIALGQRADSFALTSPPEERALPVFESYLDTQSDPMALAHFEPGLLSALVAAGRVRVPERRLSRQQLLQLECACIIILLARPIAIDRLRQVGCGDVFIICWRHAIDHALRLESPIGHWHLQSRPDGSARVEVRDIFRSTQEEGMTTDSKYKPSGEGDDDRHQAPADGSKTVAQNDAAPNERLAHVPLEVAFELGQMNLSLAELERLKPGYVFSLPVPVEGTNVTIRVQGRALGRGQIVAVGEYLGVRVQRWSSDGSGSD